MCRTQRIQKRAWGLVTAGQSLSERWQRFCLVSSLKHLSVQRIFVEWTNEWRLRSKPAFLPVDRHAHLKAAGTLQQRTTKPSWRAVNIAHFLFVLFVCFTPPGLPWTRNKTKTRIPNSGFYLKVRGLRKGQGILVLYSFQAFWNDIDLKKTTTRGKYSLSSEWLAVKFTGNLQLLKTLSKLWVFLETSLVSLGWRYQEEPRETNCSWDPRSHGMGWISDRTQSQENWLKQAGCRWGHPL